MGPKHTKRSGIATFWGVGLPTFFLFDPYFGRNSGFEIFMMTMGSTVILNISNPEFLAKYWPNKKLKLENITLKFLLFRFNWYFLDPYGLICTVKKVNFKMFSFWPIVKFMIFLYKQNTLSAGPISFQKLRTFGKTFSWHRHSICHYGLPTNSQFGSTSPG